MVPPGTGPMGPPGTGPMGPPGTGPMGPPGVTTEEVTPPLPSADVVEEGVVADSGRD